MSLIPHEMAEKMMYQQRYKDAIRPQATHSMTLDKEMQEILSKTNISEYDKALTYMDLLRQYLSALQNSKDTTASVTVTRSNPLQPLEQPQKPQPPTPKKTTEDARMSPSTKADLRESGPPPGIEASPSYTTKRIVNIVPNYSRAKARKLVKILYDDPKFTWDVDGEISINGENIKGSNIKTMVHNASTNPKQTHAPIGVQSVLNYLRGKDSITSADVITNRNWKSNLGMSFKTPSKTPRTRQTSPLSSWNSPMSTSYPISYSFENNNNNNNNNNDAWESWS
jgi:hypothetical protein